MSEVNWLFLVRTLLSFPHELRNEKNKYVFSRLFGFLRTENNTKIDRVELMASDQLPAGGKEGFRVYLLTEARDTEYFEFVRLEDETFAFRSTVMSPPLSFEAIFDFENMSSATRNLLNFCFNKGLEQLLAA